MTKKLKESSYQKLKRLHIESVKHHHDYTDKLFDDMEFYFSEKIVRQVRKDIERVWWFGDTSKNC